MDRKLLKKIICLLKDSLMRFYKQIVRNFSCFKNASNGNSDTAPSVFQDLGSFLLVIRQGLIYEQKHYNTVETQAIGQCHYPSSLECTSNVSTYSFYFKNSLYGIHVV